MRRTGHGRKHQSDEGIDIVQRDGTGNIVAMEESTTKNTIAEAGFMLRWYGVKHKHKWESKHARALVRDLDRGKGDVVLHEKTYQHTLRL